MNEPVNPEVAILNGALEVPKAQRDAYLEKVCAGNARLLQQVETLIQSHEQAGGFMEAAPAVLELQKKRGTIPLSEKPGDKIGRYKLLEQIGEGGCGIVYMAEQEEPVRRRVAVKVIKLGMDTKQVIARFEAERQALALMDHPNIARVLDAGATEMGRPYFVMELVRGVKITDFCDENTVSTADRLKLFMQVCQAVQHAHQKGIIHRDIKPSNILVTVNDGQPVPKVIDFGIAKATQGRLTNHTLFTAFEQFIGTPAYMSPEQAVMTSLDVDTRSDIYSLGVLLYELLTGRTPFDQKELLAAGLDEMRRTIREQEPPKPSKVVARESDLKVQRSAGRAMGRFALNLQLKSLSTDLDWIVMKCLEKDRVRRYETANGLAADINRHLKNEAVIARPPGRAYSLQKMVRRNRGAVLAGSGALAALLLALVVLAISNVRTARERNQKDLALGQRNSALVAAQKSEQKAKDQLFLSLRSQARASRFSRQMGQRFESLAALSEAAKMRPEEGLRDDAIAALAVTDIRRGPNWHAPLVGFDLEGFAFDATYEHYARVDAEGTVSIFNLPENREIYRFSSGGKTATLGPESGLLFSPDGTMLARAEDEHRLRVWRWADGQPILAEPVDSCWGVAFSLDSRLLAVGQSNQVVCFDLLTGRERNRWLTVARPYSLAFNPDNRKLAVGYFSNSTNVSVYDAADGTLLTSLPAGPSREEVVAWHPDGRRLAVGGSDPRIQIWDVETRRKVATMEGHVQQITILSFHPDGELLASRAWDGIALGDAASGRQWLRLPFYGVPQFSRDGRWCGVTWLSEEAQLVEVASGKQYRTLGCTPRNDQDPSSSIPINHTLLSGDISPDGRLLAQSTVDGVRLRLLASGIELGFLPLGFTSSVLFTPDGNELLTCGASGLQRWPIHPGTPAARELRLGPPHRIPLPFETPLRCALSRDGRTIAVVSEESGGAQVLDLAKESARSTILPHPRCSFLALSSNAQWVATSGWHSDRVRLWDARAGKLTKEWTNANTMNVFFTPDSRRLIVGSAEGFRFYDLKTLELGLRLPLEAEAWPGGLAFSADGTLMAMNIASSVIHLKEVSTGRTVAKLEDPFGDRANWLAFTPSGTQLVVDAPDANLVHIWDLRAIRAQLKPLGLDWNWPDFQPSESRVNSRSRFADATLKIQIISEGKPDQ